VFLALRRVAVIAPTRSLTATVHAFDEIIVVAGVVALHRAVISARGELTSRARHRDARAGLAADLAAFIAERLRRVGAMTIEALVWVAFFRTTRRQNKKEKRHSHKDMFDRHGRACRHVLDVVA
jgi:hypothetical protein